MKSEKIIWGLIFIFVGSILLLDNFGVIEFYWRSVWRFWPLIFILLGASMLYSRLNNNTSIILTAITTLAALLFIGYQGTQPRNNHKTWFHDNSEETHESTSWSSTNNFTETFNPNTKKAELNIQGGATSYTLTDTTTNLFDASVKQHYGNYTLEKISRDSTEVLTFRMRGKKGKWNTDDLDANEAEINLNKNPIWNINVEMGAGETDFDLSQFKVENLHIKGGAASFNMKLGTLHSNTSVFVEAGVAEVDIKVPAKNGCKITIDSGLSSKNFKGFEKQSDGSYITNNYNSASNKIQINLKGGLADFEVSRY